MLKVVVRVSVALVLIWIAFVLFGLYWVKDIEPNDIAFQMRDENSYYLMFIRYFSSLSQASFSFLDLLSPGYWAEYLAIFLACLGAIGGLLEIYKKVWVTQATVPEPSHEFSSDRRRNIGLLVVSVALASVIGTFGILESVRKKYILDRLNILEVHLRRFEGLMFNSAAISSNKSLVDTFFVYLFGYFQRIAESIIWIEAAFEFPEAEEFRNKTNSIGESIDKLRGRGFVFTDPIGDIVTENAKGDEVLLQLLNDLEFLQEIVRRYSRKLER